MKIMKTWNDELWLHSCRLYISFLKWNYEAPPIASMLNLSSVTHITIWNWKEILKWKSTGERRADARSAYTKGEGERGDWWHDKISSLVRSRHIPIFVYGSHQSYLTSVYHIPQQRTWRNSIISRRNGISHGIKFGHSIRAVREFTYENEYILPAKRQYENKSQFMFLSALISASFRIDLFTSPHDSIVAFSSHRLVQGKFAEQFVAGADGRFT